MPSDLYAELSDHLNKAPESIAFMCAVPPDANNVFEVTDLRLISPPPTSLSLEDHCELDDDTRAQIIRWAWDNDSCLIEAHSHGLVYSPAQFSRFDLVQLAEWVPHVRWRLAGRPYAALVTASREIDGLAWMGEAPEPVESIVVDGQVMACTGRSFLDLEARREH